MRMWNVVAQISSLPLTSAEKRAECLDTNSLSSWSRLQSIKLASHERIPTKQAHKHKQNCEKSPSLVNYLPKIYRKILARARIDFYFGKRNEIYNRKYLYPYFCLATVPEAGTTSVVLTHCGVILSIILQSQGLMEASEKLFDSSSESVLLWGEQQTMGWKHLL